MALINGLYRGVKMNILLVVAVVALVIIAVGVAKMAWQPKVVAAPCCHHNISEYTDNDDWRLAGIVSYQCNSCFKDFGHCKPNTLKN